MNTNIARRFSTAFGLIAAGSLIAVAPSLARDDGDQQVRRLGTELTGYNEVHFSGGPPATLRGAVSTKAKGKFRAAIDHDRKVIHYELEYKDLEGAVTQAHIHFGQPSTVGGIVVWLCQTAETLAPPGAPRDKTPFCPADTSGGPVRGMIEADQVLPQVLQGIEAGEFDEVVRALRAGATYANVHTQLHPPGEIRGQIETQHHRH